MPELPEVETIRCGLEAAVVGATILDVKLSAVRLRQSYPEHFAERLTGRRIVAVRRRAKYLLIDLDGGETLLSHLGMSGAWRVQAGEARALTHDHIRLRLADGRTLVYRDPRRFGLATLCPTAEIVTHPLLAGLGPEPLGDAFDAVTLLARCRGKAGALKPFLMDQKVVVGVGNIYASEACFRARVSPFLPAGELTRAQARRLVLAIRDVLEEAIASGGSTLRDYAGADGAPGYFQHRFEVYGREGEPCTLCGAPIRRAIQAQRATYWCAKCQKP